MKPTAFVTGMTGQDGPYLAKLLIEKGADYEKVKGQTVIKSVLESLKEELCTELLEMTIRNPREYLMKLEYRELKAMVEGHPSRLNLAEDPDFLENDSINMKLI